MYSEKFIDLFHHQPRKATEKITAFHENLAATLQKKLEEVVFALLNNVYADQKNPNLCLSGGVALNSVLNGKILDNTPFKKLFIPPDPGDAGGAMGAALYFCAKHDQLKKAHLGNNFSPYLGPSFTDKEIKSILKNHDNFKSLTYQVIKTQPELLNLVSDYLIDKKVIGWFQGRMEWGPRALGNRSILASATDAAMQEIINSRVKNRELFRPFAPVILEEKVAEYFKVSQKTREDESPSNRWMLTVYPFLTKAKKAVPAVVHVDGSGRLESLRSTDNPLYYNLLSEYYKKTHIPILINTSFNVKGEPIICSPEEAIDCLLKTGIDYLVIGQFILAKK